MTKFGHVIAYLTMVYCSNISEERRRAAVHVVIPLLKSLDISKYITRERSDWDQPVNSKKTWNDNSYD